MSDFSNSYEKNNVERKTFSEQEYFFAKLSDLYAFSQNSASKYPDAGIKHLDEGVFSFPLKNFQMIVSPNSLSIIDGTRSRKILLDTQGIPRYQKGSRKIQCDKVNFDQFYEEYTLMLYNFILPFQEQEEINRLNISQMTEMTKDITLPEIMNKKTKKVTKELVTADRERQETQEAHVLTNILVNKWKHSYDELLGYREGENSPKPTRESYAFAMEGYEHFAGKIVEYKMHKGKGSNKFLDASFYKKKGSLGVELFVKSGYLTIADYDKGVLYIIDMTQNPHKVVDFHAFYYAGRSQQLVKNSQTHLSQPRIDQINNNIMVSKFEHDFARPVGTAVSNLGFMLTGDKSRDKSTKAWNGIFLGGLEKGINDFADKRGIAIHPASRNTEGCIGYSASTSSGEKAYLPFEIETMLVEHSLVFGYTTQRKVEYVAKSQFCQELLEKYEIKNKSN